MALFSSAAEVAVTVSQWLPLVEWSGQPDGWFLARVPNYIIHTTHDSSLVLRYILIDTRINIKRKEIKEIRIRSTYKDIRMVQDNANISNRYLVRGAVALYI